MKITPLIMLSMASFALLILSSCTSSKQRPLNTEAHVDLQRYAGHWYEQFRLPNTFQKDDAMAEAHYTPLPDGSISVVNTETRPDRSRKSAAGIATVVPDGRNSRLKVKFEGLAAIVPTSDEGNYWIIKVAPDYSTALVGTPDRKFLWLLSRDRVIPITVREAYLKEAQRQGFDISVLIYRKR
jgi:apolipoprotein D and lipocalin family protein